jgi:hypothetical protein
VLSGSSTLTSTCAICGRSLLTGERAVRYAPTGSDFVDVCPLCQEVAVESGWLKEGSPTTPMVPAERRRRRLSLASLFERTPATEQPVAAEPILRRLSEDELSIVDAADIFNASTYRRTVEGIAKSLGDPHVSIVPLSGVTAEMVITVAWDLSWYQYRVNLEGTQPVRLEERGYELSELSAAFQAWNAHLGDGGRVVPDIARV